MKVHILFRDVDYEGSNVICVYKNLRTANARCKWCEENQRELREYAHEREHPLTKKWYKYFGEQSPYPGDSYHVATYEVL
jgi:hypothetical protein